MAVIVDRLYLCSRGKLLENTRKHNTSIQKILNFFRSTAFFDIRVTHVNSKSKQNKAKSVILKTKRLRRRQNTNSTFSI